MQDQLHNKLYAPAQWPRASPQMPYCAQPVMLYKQLESKQQILSHFGTLYTLGPQCLECLLELHDITQLSHSVILLSPSIYRETEPE